MGANFVNWLVDFSNDPLKEFVIEGSIYVVTIEALKEITIARSGGGVPIRSALMSQSKSH